MKTENIVLALQSSYPDTQVFSKKQIVDTAEMLECTKKDYKSLISSDLRVSRGMFNLSALMTKPMDNVIPMNKSTMNQETFVKDVDPNFVPWGYYSDIIKILKTKMFFPIYIEGLSGNGKTFMAEQACAKLGLETIRVQINPETDEDDLIGGFRLVDGETVFSYGPVIKAMKRGAVLILDEVDRATNKIMCLQGIMEGNEVIIKKTGEVIKPKQGFTVIATANTKGRGSETGKFTAAGILDDAFLERFKILVEQKFPGTAVETKILTKLSRVLDCEDDEYITNLINWADAIRKTYYDDGVDEVISTRRLTHIIETYSIFKDRLKAIDLCISRFDEETKEAFLDLYTKVEDPNQLDEEV